METEKFEDNSDTRGWLLKDGKRRALDVFYTDYGTKLFVEDGVLIEERVPRQEPDDNIYATCNTPPRKPDVASEEAEKHIRSQNIITSEAALAYYNLKHRTNYELVDAIASNPVLWSSGIWYHCNFKAKRPGEFDKFFFAEMTVADTEYLVTACLPVELGLFDEPNKCEMCGDNISSEMIIHPKKGFQQGRYDSKRHILRPRKKGRVC